ncbi:MAG: glycolate oxidase subunit GlcF [Gammaproteobacteria bacterium]|jgi:glycolate oxidase iron-sulfur subunit
MRAKFSDAVLDTVNGREMTAILRACVHCGFCNATCPTYQLTGDELDGPRGRIYLIKSMLEDAAVGEATQRHLDRCLTCRACETTCPSGVQYSRLLDAARPLVDAKVPRKPGARLQRWLIRKIVPYPARFRWLAAAGRLIKHLAPRAVAELVPGRPRKPVAASVGAHSCHMILLQGCVQSAVSPAINEAAREIFDALGIALVTPPRGGCCGAVAYHLGEADEARTFARRNIDVWTQAIAGGAQAVLATSSGCAVMLREYGELLRDDPIYADRAARVAELVCDPAEVIDPAALAAAYRAPAATRIAFQSPCTLRHGLRSADAVESCLTAVGFELTDVPDAHLCCGSAGSYSLLQPELSGQLLDNKLAALERGAPEAYVSANIGCLMHLQRRAERPVRHWLEMIRPHRVGPDRSSE